MLDIHSNSGDSSGSTTDIDEDMDIEKKTKKGKNERQVGNKYNELLLRNVLPTTTHDGNIILHMHQVHLNSPVL